MQLCIWTGVYARNFISLSLLLTFRIRGAQPGRSTCEYLWSLRAATGTGSTPCHVQELTVLLGKKATMSILRRHECYCTSTQQTAVSTVSRARSRACTSTITKQQKLRQKQSEARRVVRSTDTTHGQPSGSQPIQAANPRLHHPARPNFWSRNLPCQPSRAHSGGKKRDGRFNGSPVQNGRPGTYPSRASV